MANTRPWNESGTSVSPRGVSILSNLSGVQPLVSSDWDRSKICHICFEKLGVTRRHHCRFCGKTACKHHSQHSQRHPETGDVGRCCDTCYKELTGKDTRQEIEACLAELRAKIASEMIEVQRRRREAIELVNALSEKRIALESAAAAAQAGIAQREKEWEEKREERMRLEDIVETKKKEKRKFEKLIAEKAPNYGNLKAECTENRQENKRILQRIGAMRRKIAEEKEKLIDRVPRGEVRAYVGRCCEPKIDGISLIGSGSFNVSRYRDSLIKSTTSNKAPEISSKSCTCTLF